MQKLLSALKKIGKGIIVLLFLMFLVHSILLAVWGRALRKELDSIRAEGAPVSITDLKPKPIPDSENGAVLYDLAFREYQRAPNEKIRLRQFKCDEDISSYLGAKTKQDEARFGPGARLAVQSHYTVIPLIDKAQARQKCVFMDTKWSEFGSIGVEYLTNLRDLSRLLQAKALLDARDGRMDAATDDIVRLIRLSDATRYEPRSILGQGFRQGVVRTTSILLKRVSASHPLSYDQSKRIYDELGRLSFTPEFIRAYQGDRAQFNSYFDTSRKDLTTFLQITGLGNAVPEYRDAPFHRPTSEAETEANLGNPPKDPGHLRRLADRFINYLWRPFSYRDQLAYLQCRMDPPLKVADLPYREGSKILSRQNKGRCLYVRLTGLKGCEAHGSIWRVRDQAIAYQGIAQTTMAVSAYRSRFGRLPSSIDEVKKLGWKLPKDPFTGRLFAYRREADGFTVSSPGIHQL